MKNLIKYILIGILLFSSKSVAAQKELVLDSVFTISKTLVASGTSDTVTYYVPIGETWKIENLSIAFRSGGYSCEVYVNGKQIVLNDVYNKNGSAGINPHRLLESALWLGPGDALKFKHLNSGYSDAFASVLQFKLE